MMKRSFTLLAALALLACTARLDSWAAADEHACCPAERSASALDCCPAAAAPAPVTAPAPQVHCALLPVVPAARPRRAAQASLRGRKLLRALRLSCLPLLPAPRLWAETQTRSAVKNQRGEPMKKIMLAVLVVGLAAAAYAANCCGAGASCCPGPCCEAAQ